MRCVITPWENLGRKGLAHGIEAKKRIDDGV